MKKIVKILVVLPLASIFLITSFFISFKKVGAQVVPGLTPIPYGTAVLGPQITSIEVCCNGLEFTIDIGVSDTTGVDAATLAQYAKLVGTYIFPWQNMTPLPGVGTGLYQWWTLAENSKVLGNKIPGIQALGTDGTCVTVESECESADKMDWTVLSMGTNLISLYPPGV